MIEHVIPTGTHGRYLVDPPAPPPDRWLVGFHGYAEDAAAQLERMRRIPGADRWLLVSIQALHRFYRRRADQVVASWMTRQDRELAIADNLAYVAAVLDSVDREYPGRRRLVFTGFSQGVAMTLRAAAASPRPVDGVIAVGGDVPPDIDAAALGRVPHALVCRGTRDEWYTRAIFERDVERLRQAGAGVHPLEFDGGHEWPDAVVEAASTFLRQREP
ncbi:MAG: putative esterase [Acidobacteria bacterium]|nr:putative esterase [Acidobacteriota bacterium]